MKIQLRHDTAANWIAANPTLASGEFGAEDDTTLFKKGDGVTAWNDLAYANSGTIIGASGIAVVDVLPAEPDPDTIYITTT